MRLKKGVIAEGAAFLIHKNTGRKPQHSLDENVTEKIIALKQSETYQSANFLHFQELLETKEDIKLSYSALHSLLTNLILRVLRNVADSSLIAGESVNLKKAF